MQVNSLPEKLKRMDSTAGAGLQGVTNAPGQGPVQPNPAAQKAWDNAAVMADATAAGAAAQEARYKQKMGYLYKDNLPATSDPSQDAYWARADMKAWANANQGLAKKKGWDPSRNYSAPTGTTGIPDEASGYSTAGAQVAPDALTRESFGAAPVFPSSPGMESKFAMNPSLGYQGEVLGKSAQPEFAAMPDTEYQGEPLSTPDAQSARTRAAAVATGPLALADPAGNTSAWNSAWSPDGEQNEPIFDPNAMRDMQRWNPRMMRGF